ncbi:MAG: mechanosensitive ion channel family protein, partial [Prochloraceae cyanobacterium]
MRKYWQFLITLIIVTCLTVIIQPWHHFLGQMAGDREQITLGQVMAQEASDSDQSDSDKADLNNEQKQVTPDKPAAPVVFNGETLFSLTSQLENISASERAERVVIRIKRVAEDYSQSMDSVKSEQMAENVFVVSSSEREILMLTNEDAQIVNRPLEDLSHEYADKIKAAIAQYRKQRSFSQMVKSAIYTILSLGAFILVVRTINWIHKFNENFYKNWLRRHLAPDDHRARSGLWEWLNIIGFDLYRLLYAIHKIIYWSVVLVIAYLFIPLILSFFPLTHKLSDAILSGLSNTLSHLGNAFLDYLPNLFIIISIFAVIYFITGYCKRFFLAIENETISLPGFYPDWAKPTYKLSVFLIVAFTLALIYSYLPGADSASFQGISIFIGALVTIGGAGTLASLVGGFIIIYTRAYQIGDRIEVDNIKGDVVEKTILSTRICTLDNEVVTIPNSSIVGSNIVNYTAALRDFKRPLVLRATITLGYDVPWRKVYQTLVSAANATSHIIKEPAPFVIQISLDDYYVSYQLKAYTEHPELMVKTYSELYEHIQDKCNE